MTQQQLYLKRAIQHKVLYWFSLTIICANSLAVSLYQPVFTMHNMPPLDTWRAYGYLSVKTECMQGTVRPCQAWHVQPGPRWTLDSLQLLMYDEHHETPIRVETYTLSSASTTFKTWLGQPWYPTLESSLERQCQIMNDAKGYLTAMIFEKECILNKTKHTIHLRWHVILGQPYRIHTMILTPNLSFFTPFIKRFHRQHYAPEDINKLYVQFYETGFFKNLNVDPVFNDHDVTITWRGVMAKPSYEIGGGYITHVGPRVRLRGEWPMVNTAGHSLRTQISYAPDWMTIVSEYWLQPHFLTASHSKRCVWQLNGMDQIIDDRHDRTWSLRLAQRIQQDQKRLTIGWSYQDDYFETTQGDWHRTHYWIPSMEWQPMNLNAIPHYWYQWWLKLPFSRQEMWLMGGIQWQTWYTLQKEKLRLKIEANDMIGAHLNDHMPPSLLFFTGGPDTIRGYRFQSIGPGLHQYGISAEWAHPYRSKQFLTLFIDAGNASATWLSDLKSSIGVGWLLSSAIGAVEISISQATTHAFGPQWSLQINPSFPDTH
jgi:translocation and assembly module TamA